MMEQEIKLIVIDGELHTRHDDIKEQYLREWFSSDPILLVSYPAGDYDTIKWPNPNEQNLISALFDARETGKIPDVRYVTLPDGTQFKIDQ